MLRIRKEQMDFFADKTREAYLDQLSRYVAEVHGPRLRVAPADVPEAAERFARAAIEKADALHFHIEYDATQLALVLLLLGLDAEEKHAFVREILAARDLAPRGKVRRLVDALYAREIEGALEVDLGEPTEAA